MAITIDENTGKASDEKDYEAVLDYPFDWSAWLDAINDTIDTAEATVKGEDIGDAAIVQVDVSIDKKSAVVWVSGGKVDSTVQVDCKITTSSVPARVESKSLFLKIKDK